MAGPSAWTVYNEFKLALGKKIVNISATDSIKMALFQSTSNAGSASLSTAQFATLTNQVAGSNGYTTNGVVVTQSWTNSSGTETFTITSASWFASGGSIVARFAVLYDDTATNKDLIAYCTLDSTPADVTTTTGNTLIVAASGSGVFTLA